MANIIIDNLLKQLKSDITSSIISGVKTKKILLKSDDRSNLKRKVEAWLTKNSLQYESRVISGSGFPATIFNNFSIIYKPNKAAKGTGGKDFEDEFAADMKVLLGCKNIEKTEFLHPDVVQELIKILPKPLIQSNKAIVKLEGSKNQKRDLKFISNQFVSNLSSGATLTDVTVEDGSKKYYFSLKMSKTYYLINASIFEYFKNPKTRKAAYEWFGLDGTKMGEYDKLIKAKTPIYYQKTSPINTSRVKLNIEKLIKSALGEGYYFVHKKQENAVTAFYNGGGVKIKCNMIESIVYPEKGKRKYTAIKTRITLDGNPYVCTLQFRGTKETDVEPKYLRMLMEKK